VSTLKIAAGLGVATAAVLGIFTGIMITHGPAAPFVYRGTPAAVVQTLDTTTPTTAAEQPPVTTTPSTPTASNVTVDTRDPEHPVTIIVGPPPSPVGPSGEMHAVMPVDPSPTTNPTVPPVVTPEMPPGYPTPAPVTAPTTTTN
jgi:hypothetical protein